MATIRLRRRPPGRSPPTGTAPGGAAGTNQRPDRWGGQSIAGNRPSGWSDNGVDVGAPRTGIARAPADPASPSALESARSNITAPITQVTTDAVDGETRQVIAAGDGPRRVVVDANGRTTGEIIAVGTDGQARIITDETVPAGIDGDDAIANHPTDNHRPATDGTGNTGPAGTGDDIDVVAANVAQQGYQAAAMAAAVAGALAGAAFARSPRRARILPRITPATADGGGMPPTPWAGKSAQFGWIQPDGDLQRFVVMADESSARTHRFDMDVPDGGQMVKTPDGSVDVVDADGRIVDHVKAPWAYDAAGKPVTTWYEVDNDTGELVQHIAPDESTVFPIIADPEQSKSTATKTKKTKATSQPPKKSQSNVIDPKTRAAMDRSQAGKNAADKQKAQSNPPKQAPTQKKAPAPATKQRKPAAKPAPAKTTPKQSTAKTPTSTKAAPKETPQQQIHNDAQRAERQPGFIGPVSAEDKAGRQRNQQRIDNNKHAAVSAGNNDPAKIRDTDTTKPVQASPTTPRPTPSQAPESLWNTKISNEPPKHFNSPDPNSKPKQPTTNPSELEEDRTLASRQPGFIGPLFGRGSSGPTTQSPTPADRHRPKCR